MKSSDYELICPNKSPVPVSDYASCHLAKVPAHAVVTRPEKRGAVVRVLQNQQVRPEFFCSIIDILLLSYRSRGGTGTVLGLGLFLMLPYRRTVEKCLFFSSLIVFALPHSSLQIKFGTRGNDDAFRLFQSESGKNLLFKDSTKCLQVIPEEDSFKKFLGNEYVTAMTSLRTCTANTPGL